jgi:hypothetical protein
MKLYMKCTTDSLELPLAVADSTKELAEMLHMSNGSVASAISRGVCGYHKVIIPESWGNEKGEANERAIST